MTDVEHVSSFELDLFFAEREPRPELERHVAGCALCAAYLAELERLSEAGAPSWVPPCALAARSRVARGRVFAARWGLALAALVLLAVGYATSRLPEEGDYVAVKGSPAVQLLLHRAGRTQPWDGESPVRAGDALALRVACEDFVHVSVVTPGSPGGPELRRLSDAECPARPAPALPFVLPFTLLVDDEPGQERVSIVFSRSRLDDAALELALRARVRSSELWVTDFELDKRGAK